MMAKIDTSDCSDRTVIWHIRQQQLERKMHYLLEEKVLSLVESRLLERTGEWRELILQLFVPLGLVFASPVHAVVANSSLHRCLRVVWCFVASVNTVNSGELKASAGSASNGMVSNAERWSKRKKKKKVLLWGFFFWLFVYFLLVVVLYQGFEIQKREGNHQWCLELRLGSDDDCTRWLSKILSKVEDLFAAFFSSLGFSLPRDSIGELSVSITSNTW